ncbi:MAG: gliding motility-associated C-terminal domain-containing protein, partial [Bacteroidia bacterium]
CKTYTIKLAIADVGDPLLDSYVFIEAGSFQHKTSLGRDTFICKEDFDLELDAGNPGRKVKWKGTDMNGGNIVIADDTVQKIKVTSFGTYEVEIFTDCGSFIDYKKIFPGVNDISIGKDKIFCGSSFSDTLKVANRVFDSYLWSDGSTNETLTATKTGLYWLEVDRGGCKKKDSVFLQLDPLPKIDLGKDTVICGPIDLIISAKEPALKYVWYYNNNLLPTDTFIRIRANKPGAYRLWASNTNCINNDTIGITQRNSPKIDIGLPTREICENDTLVLRTGIKDTLYYRVQWNTGSISPSIFASISGHYKVTIRDKMCNFTASDSVVVTVYKGAGDVWVPNAFTPGQDNLNDVFKPVSDIGNFNYYNFLVFDRWGQILFQTNDPMKAWDGNFENKPAQNGVYIWSLNVKSNCSKGDNNFQRGIVHLIR